MTARYGNVPIIFTRLGLLIDHLIEVSKKHPSTFTRAQFVGVTRLKPTSTSDKLKDMELYGLILRNNANYTISESGQAIIRGGSERSSAIMTAINKVPLWSHLIKIIGKSPDRKTFDKTVKEVTHNNSLNVEILNQLWYAYTEDISCITKSPPFSKWSSAIRRSNPHQLRVPEPQVKHIPLQKKEIIVIPEPIVKTQITEPTIQTAENKERNEKPEVPPLKHESILNYGVIEYKGHRFEIKDDLSYGFADHIMKKIKKDLERTMGVQFEE